MATIRMTKTQRGTTITIKAGKGEDLKNVVEALAGEMVRLPNQPGLASVNCARCRHYHVDDNSCQNITGGCEFSPKT